MQEEVFSKRIQNVLDSENLKTENKTANEIGYVSDDFANLASQYGYDIKNYKHTVDNFFINHAKKNHGNNTAEVNRGNIAITEDDIKNIPSIYNHPDYIIFGTKTKTGNKAIVYVKNIGNATVFVEDVRKGKKELAAQTLYKRARTFDDLTKEKAAELYVHNDPDSITIVDTKKEFVNKKDWALLNPTETVKSESNTQTIPENTVDLTEAFDGKLKNQAEIAKYIKSISDEVFVTYDNYKIGILPKDSKHIVYTNGTPYRSQKVRMNNYLVNLEKVLANAKLKGISDAKDKKDVKEFYYFEVPIKVGNGLYTVQFDCKKNSDVVIAKEQSSNKLTDNNTAEINPKEILEINQVDCYLYNLKERVVTRDLNKSIQMESNTQTLPQGMHSLANAMKIVKAREEVFDNEVNKESTEEKKDVNKKEKVDIVKKGALDFLNAVKNGTAPFLNKSNEDIGIITIKPPLVLNSNTGLPFSGSSQLLAQIYYEKQKMEGEIVTSFAGAKNAGTEIVKNELAKKNFVLSDTSLLSEENKVLKTRYFMPEACREPEKIYAYTLSKQRPQKINEYRDLIRHFENVPNGQKEIADFRIKIAEEHLKELRVKFSSKEEQGLSLEQISERKDFIKNYFEKLPEKVRDIEKSVFENTFGISIDIEKDYSGKNIPEKTKKQMEQKLSDFIVKNSMSENKLAALSKDEYKEQLKNQKEMGNNVEIKAVGIKEPEIYLGKYLAACQSNAKFITDEETINAVQKNLEEKLKSNFRFEKYEILKEIGQQAEQISKETTKTLSFEKAHSNKKSNNLVIAKAQKIAPIGMGK